MRRSRLAPLAAFLALAHTACSSTSSTRNDAGDVGDASSQRDVARDQFVDTAFVDVTFASDAPAPSDASSDTSASCARGMYIDRLARCIDTPTAPATCLAMLDATLCDDDHDGLGDDFEAALARSYALAFAFNHGDGSHRSGDPETHWPDNLTHYTAGSHLIYRVDNDSSTERAVNANPALDTLADARITIDGMTYRANDPAQTQGGNFWLCLDQPGGDYPASALNATMDSSRSLADGIDVLNVVHPAGGIANGSFAFVATLLFYPYNEHSTIDNHEGDFEGGAVLVDLANGRVAGVFLDRHDSADNVRLLSLVGTGAVRAIDPASESTFGDICSESDAARARGVRFWDFNGARHHVVAYVSTGGHSAYPYPGNTKITGAGCVEWTIVRDTHNGDGARFLPWRNAFASAWTNTPASLVTHGVHFHNAGETLAPLEAWANYRGQWGCQNATIAKSWPGPFGNQRHCRAWITTDGWGDPPFTVPTLGCP